MNKTELIEFYIDNGILVSPDLFNELDVAPLPLRTQFTVLGKDSLHVVNSKKSIVIEDFEKAIVLKEKHKDLRLYSKFIEYLKEHEEHDKSFEHKSSSKEIFPITPSVQADPVNRSSIISSSKTSPRENSTETYVNPSKGSFVDSIVKSSNIQSSPADNLAVDSFKSSSYESSSAKPVPVESPDSSQKQQEDKKVILKNPLLDKTDFMKEHKIKIVSSYNTKVRKWVVHDFVSLYNARFKELEKILRSRQELSSLTSIARISAKKERENVALIGVVYDKGLTKTGNIMLTLEDPTGMVKVVVTKAKEDLFRLAEEIQLDEVIGVTGMFDNIIFASSILIPDIPLTKELKKSPDEGYFLIIADPEPGSKLFLDKEFEKLISWINGEVGSDKQRDIASKIRYIFIAGDLVNGVGIYPNQEFDLNILDIKDQYKALADLLKQVPSSIPIFICPGNHDVGRISEPQPAIDEEYASDLVFMPNVISLSNPCTVNIFAQPENNFDGFDVMMYHGYSFIYYSENIPTIRKSGGQKRPDLIMKYLLQRRHLAPSHTSTLYIPDPKVDPLVIDKIPDFFISGHVHRAMVANYKNVTCINASCWTGQSEEQERRGLEAQPARAFIVDMRTREVKILNFMPKDEEKEANANTQTDAPTEKAKSEAAQNG